MKHDKWAEIYNKEWKEYPNGDIKTFYFGENKKKAMEYAHTDRNLIDGREREVMSIKLIRKHKPGFVKWTKKAVSAYAVIFGLV